MQSLPRRDARSHRGGSRGAARMKLDSCTTLFEEGTPDEPGIALASYREAMATSDDIRWFVDPGNIGLLSRAVRELPDRKLEVVLRAEDISDTETIVAHESDLAPTLRRLRTSLVLRMTNGRPYMLPPPALDISTNDLCGLACNMCGNRAPSRDPQTISAAEVDMLIEEAAAWGIRRVALTGAGEPFRDPAMLDHIR